MIDVPREQMPQVDEKDIGKLLVFMGRAGVGVRAGEALATAFTFHQKIDPVKAAGIAAVPSLLAKPVLCTNKFEIIDGDHRTEAHRLNATMTPYIMFDCSFAEALNLLNVFPFAYELTSLTPERN